MQYKRNNVIELSIVKTLSYSDIFDYPLTLNEIFKYYIGEKVSRKKIHESISAMVRLGLIGKDDELHYLNGRKVICALRQKRASVAQRKWKIAQQTVELLKIIPTIKLIGVSGSLSMDNCEVLDDIDLFFITSENSLWITRFFVNLLLMVGKLKRFPGEAYGPDKICPNMFVTLNTLKIDKNLFSAHEIVQMKPIVNRDSTFEKFISANHWVLSHLPNSIANSTEIRKIKTTTIGNGVILRLIDSIFYAFQYEYMKKRITSEKITKNSAKFHPKDKTNFVRFLYRNRYKNYISYLRSSNSQNSPKMPFLATSFTSGY